VAFQAIHLPVQAPRAYTDRYDGRFDRGWDVLRAERAARVQGLGLVPEEPLAAMPEGTRRWEDLGPDDRALYARMMQVNAGMLEAMDVELGRLLDHLQEVGHRANTLVVVVSDNGPESAEIPIEHEPLRALLDAPLLERLGEHGTTASIGAEWATVSASPLSLFKFYSSEGGLRVPMVLAGPGVPAAKVVHARGHLTDVLPTVLDLVDVPLTPMPADGPQLRGRSLVPAVLGEVDEVYAPDEPVAFEVAGNAALFRGDHKLVFLTPPYGDGTWHLYDVRTDPGETRDLAAEKPELVADMLSDYESFAAEVGVAKLPPDYDPVRQIWINSTLAVLRKLAPLIVVGVGLVFGLLLWGVRRRTRSSPSSPSVGH